MAGKTNYTKCKIVETTIIELQNADYHDLSLRKLAGKVGLTTGAFYKHFKSRDELFTEVTAVISNRIDQNIEQAIRENSSTSAKEKILIFANQLLQSFADQPHLMNFLFFNPIASKALSFSPDEVERFPLLALITNLIHELALSTNLEHDENFLFVQFWAFIQGYAVLLDRKITKYEPEVLRCTLNQFLLESSK
ncbi:TetR/AcrR family transcriptional regulator [Xylocopilactobacillus apicola]|uniref:TetR family transcriptional regulator n=1 Tax=Xylocopilactobacillus apicola TaxID=2932184 RepID=A0AAU9D2N8_9LACO|nr:TetR/AcrR family transcriptional regulator [Xylocopilactobacillus apicola]BDR57999.1 TetR family transcriptional regulator [Xylocopilactobacillus apicola]